MNLYPILIPPHHIGATFAKHLKLSPILRESTLNRLLIPHKIKNIFTFLKKYAQLEQLED